MKEIDGVIYNVKELQKYSFDEFRKLFPNYTDDKAKNIYFIVTGIKINEIIKEKKVKSEKKITEIKVEEE